MTVSNETASPPVLAAVDFSDDSRAALIWAAKQAELQGSPLFVLHVVHDPAASPGFYRLSEESRLRPMIDVAETMMESFVEQTKSEHPELSALVTPHVRLVSGLPAGRILEVAGETGAGLVVVGSRGATALQSVLLGSVAERVAQMSEVPVVIVKTRPPDSSQ